MIDLMPDAEQDALIEWVRDFLDKELPRNGMLTSDVDDPSIVQLMGRIGELGLFRLADAGSRVSYVDEALVFRELGRRLVPGPVIWTTLAADLAYRVGDPDLGTAFAGGKSLAGIAELVDDDRVMILDSAPVDHLLLVDPRAAQVSLVRYDRVPTPEYAASIDPFHRVAFVPADFGPPVVESGDQAAAVLAHARVLVAAYMTGLAEAARDDSAAYTSERVQFGKPIAVFQAVKHRCADNALRAEAAWASTIVAALRLDTVPLGDAELDVAVAKLVAGDSAVRNSRDNIQNHGGMGYTFENLAHLYLKRAHVLINLFGDTRSFTDYLLETAPSW